VVEIDGEWMAYVEEKERLQHNAVNTEGISASLDVLTEGVTPSTDEILSILTSRGTSPEPFRIW
jgi:hypothetical protein